MEIVCFIDNLGAGGAQRQITSMAVSFQKRGHRVRVLTYHPDEFFLSVLIKANVGVECINESNPIKRILKVRKILRGGDQDAVVSFLDTPNFLACLSAIGGRKWALVVGERSANLASFTNMKTRFMKSTYKYADYIVTNSNNARDIWTNTFPNLYKKLRTLYNVNTVDIQAIEYIPKKDGKLHIVIAASYRKIKNIDGLIDAVNLLGGSEKERLVIDWYGKTEIIEGDTHGYNDALVKIDDYGLTKTVHLYSETQDIITKMIEADIVGLFSHYEGLPNAICEGMALGRPIIMSRVSDYDILVDERNGFLCDSNDPKSIAVALNDAINAPVDGLLEMGSVSKKRARELFDTNAIVEGYIELFLSIYDKVRK